MFAAADVNRPTRPIEGIGRLLMRVACVALAFIGTPDAQAQTKAMVPVPGFYAHAAPGANMLYEKRDAENAHTVTHISVRKKILSRRAQ